jgi:hypothetical protein
MRQATYDKRLRDVEEPALRELMQIGGDAQREIINMIVKRKLPWPADGDTGGSVSPKAFHHDLSSQERNVSNPAIGADIEYFYKCLRRWLFGKCLQSSLVVTNISIVRRNRFEEVAA